MKLNFQTFKPCKVDLRVKGNVRLVYIWYSGGSKIITTIFNPRLWQSHPGIGHVGCSNIVGTPICPIDGGGSQRLNQAIST